MWKIILSSLIIISLSIKSSINVKAECGKTKIRMAVPLSFNGTSSYAGQWPWLALLFRFNDRYTCGSSIITRWHLLTAAHCIITDVKNYHALLGRFDISNNNELHSIRRNMSIVYIHSDFNANAEIQRSNGDIAIFGMSEKIEFTDYIQPICLPKNSLNVFNVNGIVAGHGQIEPYGDHQNKPSHVMLKSIGCWNCLMKGLVYGDVVSEKSFCAGNQEAIPCQGDSGGGFYVYDKKSNSYTTYGVVSFAIGRCDPREYVVFVDVSKYLTWIDEKINDGNFIDPCEKTDCGLNSKCNVINKKAQCSCLPDYTGTPPDCRKRCHRSVECPDDRACLLNMCVDLCDDSSLCADNANCEMKNHKQKCECLEDYYGDGYDECQERILIDGLLNEESSLGLGFIVLTTTVINSTSSEIRSTHYSENVKSLHIHKSIYDVNYLPTNVDEIFPNLRLYEVFHQSIREISYENFKHLSKLEKIEIFHNKIEFALKTSAFDDLMQLKTIFIHESKLIHIDEFLFKNNVNLEKLDLNHNHITSVGERQFENLKQLKFLSLYNNNLTSLPENVFRNLHKLETLKLSYNKIQSLHENLLENLVNLRELELVNCQLTTLHQNLLRNCEKLERIYLARNNISSLSFNAFANNRKLMRISLIKNECISEIYGTDEYPMSDAERSSIKVELDEKCQIRA